jgi:S-adenosylmethionine:tRNA ribosyltransferase-isomerase
VNKIPDININDYNYDLPDGRIARHPVEQRDGSRLLVYTNGKISGDSFSKLIKYLPEKSLLVFNDTRVIRARLLFTKDTGAAIEVFCLEPLSPPEYQQSFSSTSTVEWKCIIGNLKKWKSGTLKMEFSYNKTDFLLKAEKVEQLGEAWRIRFSWEPSWLSFGELTEGAGHIPLPPYFGRVDEDDDYCRYQTIYAEVKGSVAAPTAGLHFTESMLSGLRSGGIDTEKITLHVGAGTFKPVKEGRIEDHEMHCEHFFVTEKCIEKLIDKGEKIVAVGTTSVRTLESLYWLGVKILENKSDTTDLTISQWEYNRPEVSISCQESFTAIRKFMERNELSMLHASTKIMILPGYRFRVINGMITNFHQPKSTLLLLIAAWTGKDWKEIYRFALENNFRFLSYGDSSLLL